MMKLRNIVCTMVLLGFVSMPVFSATVYQAGGKCGLKDKNGNVVLNAQYQSVEQLSYTPSKKVIIPMHAMDEVQTKKLNIYKIKKNGLWGIANSHGKILSDCVYKNVSADSNGDIQLTQTDGTVQYAHPVMNAAKATRDTLVTIVGLPVTLVGAAMIPVEAVSKAGRGVNRGK